MKRGNWHILQGRGALTVARQLPPRFDVAVSSALPLADPLRLAQQVRQDIWRAVQRVRGFSPVVTVEVHGEALRVTAGGRVAGRVPGNLASEIRAVLEDGEKRRRWLRHARLSARGSLRMQSEVISHNSVSGFDKEAETGQ